MSRFIAGPPTGPVVIPEAVKAVMLPGDEAKPVWLNELGGLTFRLHPARVNPCSAEYVAAGGARYVKWSPKEAARPVGESSLPQAASPVGSNLAAEAERLNWAGQWVSVPEVLEYRDVGTGEVMVTKAVPGHSAASPFWRARPQEAATALGKGLRAFHDALPVEECPFSWSVAERIEHGGIAGSPMADALLASEPPEGEFVVCHGDPCAPNLLIDNFGYVTGYLDLGRLGVASRWADLAVAAWSTEWNYGPGYENLVYQGYGMIPDLEKISYYRRLWDET